jgi:hypothetical protein
MVTAFSCLKGPGKIEGKVFSDSANNFSIEFPEGWVVNRSGYMGTAVLFLDNSKKKGFKPNINVVLQKNTVKTIKQYVESMKNSMITLLPDYKFVGISSKTINGLESENFEFGFNQKDSGRVKQSQYFFKNKSVIYIVTCSAAESEFNTYKSSFEKSANSFKFINN